MKRWKKILIWTLSALVVLGVGGLFAANYAIDKLMNSMASSFDVEETVADDTVSDEVAEPAVAAGDPTAESTPTMNPSAVSGEVVNSNNTEVTSISKPTPSAKPTATDNSADTDSSNSTPVQTAKPKDGIAHISTDKAKEVQGNITIKEKTSVASILLRELSASDIKKLQQMANGGLSKEEKKEARSIILDRLSEDQYNELIQIAKKYGLSQGNAYNEVKGSE